MYTKQQILANPNIIIHCENEQEWEECKKEFPETTYCNFLECRHNAMRPGGGLNSSASVETYMKISNIIITYKQYKTFNIPFPEKWYIHGSPEFEKFLKSGLINESIVNNNDGNDPDETWGYHIGHKGKIRFKHLDSIPDHKLVTIEQLIQHYKPQNMDLQQVITHYPNTPTNMTHTISKKQLKEIHDVACNDWKSKIKAYASKDPFSDIITFTEAEVKAMFDAATTDQRIVLRSIFVDYGKDKSIKDLKGDLKYFQADGGTAESLIALEKNSINKNRFWLNPDFTWTLEGQFLKCSVKNN